MSDGTRTIVVHSAQADKFTPSAGETGATYGDYEFTLTRPVYNVTRFALLNVDLPNCVPAIRTGVNDTLDFWYNATQYAAVVAQGTYSGADFATELASKMNTAASAGGDITVTYNETLGGILTIASTTNGTALATQTTTPRMAAVIGFVPNEGDAAGPGAGATTLNTGTLDLSGPPYLMLTILAGPAGCGFDTTHDAYGLSSFVVPITAGWLERSDIFVNATFGQRHSQKRANIEKLRVLWRDPYGDRVTFNGCAHTLYLSANTA